MFILHGFDRVVITPLELESEPFASHTLALPLVSLVGEMESVALCQD